MVTVMIAVTVMIGVYLGRKFGVRTFPLDQTMNDIQKVEVCVFHYDSKSVSVVTELEKETALELLDEITSLPCKQHFGHYTTDLGPVVLYVTYSNGEAEVIGVCNSANFDSSGEWRYKIYYFDEMPWCETVLKYVDPKIVPELVEFMEEYRRIFG